MDTEHTDWTVEMVLEACGGAGVVAAALQLTTSAVLKMKRIGIQDRHWDTLIGLGRNRFGPNDLFRANQMARGGVVGDCAACANYLPPDEAALPGPSVEEMVDEFGDAATEVALTPRGSAAAFPED
jgi:hypothetical protein